MHILITGAWREAEERFPMLENQGHEISFMKQEDGPLPCDPHRVEGVICNGLFLYHPIESFSHLRYIQLTSAGFDRVPMEYVRKKGIEIHNARGVYAIPMAEFAVGGVLAVYKSFGQFQRQQERHVWKGNRNLLELSGKQVLIIGCGDVGTECAKRFLAFGCRVIGVNRTVRENPVFESIHPLAALDSLLPAADVAVLAMGLSAETRPLIPRERLGQMKPGAVLVNLARGPLIDMAALPEALGRLGGAVLDVFEEEPLPTDNKLWNAENVIITPHNSYVGDGNASRLFDLIMRNLQEERQAGR